MRRGTRAWCKRGNRTAWAAGIMEFELDGSLKEWAKDKPLSILQLDPADRAVLRIADERDAIQKKTFTKWVNKHLKKASRHVGDLFEDLRDGHNLISLLEVLSGEGLPREKGRMRFHMLQNVQMALDFLRYKKIKLVNIRAEDIVDGNPKLTLGLIWTIILHFQISDIVVGQEPNVTAREALLRWARRSTARYPGVQVTDFTCSWRDGLAFSALLHRNRPDLVDWRTARSSQPRERLDRVFYVAEHEYGVTRLLDPEDVDTPEPDEKSLITYISSLYDVFPEPPAIHPLLDVEAQRRSAEYRELASSLHLWIREKMALMQERAFPPTLIEMKKLAADSMKFKNEEVPPRYRDKQRLTHIFRDLQKSFETVGEVVDMEAELHIDVIDKNWNRLIMLHQEREQAIIDEIKRLERLQRLAEKVHREMKTTDNRLEELERCVEDEARRLDRLHPLEAKHAVDLLEQDIRNTETQIQNIFTDVHTLTEGRYSQAPELHKRVQKLHQRWVAVRSLLHRRLVHPLSAVSFPVEERVVTKHRTTVHETRLVDTNPHFRALHDCIDWCKSKLKHLQEADYGSDLPSVQNELDVHRREHKNIDQFQAKVDKCVQAKNNFHGEELTLYNQHLSTLQKLYAELLAVSNKRLSDLETLHDFIQSATGELVWLNAKEETEIARDWSDKNLNVQSIEQYYESLMSDLEKRDIQCSAVQDRGEALVLQHHPAAKTIEAYMSAMQNQWARLLQFTLCLEVHLRHAAQNQQFFKDIQQAEQWISKQDDTLNTVYSQSDFALDEGERLLKGMQALREEHNNYGDHVQRLVERAKDIVPMKQRKQPVTRPLQVTCICTYKEVNVMSIEKGEQCTLYDTSGRVKWRVKNTQGVESRVPSVCFALQPPDKEALDAAERLRRQYDRSVALWQRKNLRLRQNMIFATIKVVKGWDLPQFLAMEQDQRTAIRKALNEDADKLLSEGDPADPQLRRLKREMADVNRLFDDFEKRARAEEESKNAGRIFNDQAFSLQQALDEAERILNARIAAPLPRDLDSLEHLVLQHKDYEQSLQRLAPDVEQMQQTFRGITLKTPAMRNKLDNITTKWNHLWNLSSLYIERLKCVEIVLSSLEENTAAISEFEIKLASFGELPSDVKGLQCVLEDLMVLQNAIAQQQVSVDQLNEDAHNARRLVEKSRPNHRGPHGDMDRLDAEVNKLNARWTNVCGQLVDRLRSAETAYGLAQQYQNSYQNEVDFVDESYGKLEMENTKNLLSKVLDRTPAIEAVNLTGGRLIREGKIYGQRLRAFKEQLEDICPSLDASVKRPRRDSVITVDIVARDLDTLNRRYTTLVNLLEERVRQLALLHPEDTSLQRVLQEQRPLRTFRTEFNIYESTTSEERYTSTTTHYTQSQYTSERHESTETTFSSETSKRSYSAEQAARRPNGETTSPGAVPPVGAGGALLKRSHESGTTSSSRRQHQQQQQQHEFSSVVDGGFSSELRDLRRVARVDDGGVIGAENVIDVRGIVDPSTGEVLTVGEAIRLRILDVRNGRIVTSSDGRTSVSIEEAARDGIIDAALADRLLGPCGVNEEGHRVSLLEAIQRELCDAERADIADRVKVTTARHDDGGGSNAAATGFSVVDAMREGLLDPATGEVIAENGERISIEEAYSRGYLTKVDVTVRVTRNAIALSDAISQGLVDDRTGRVVDRITGESYPLDEAVDKGIIDPNVKEIVDTKSDSKMTVAEAMNRGVLNAKSGRYMHGLSMEKLPFKEARRRQLIVKPMTLKDCYDLEIIDDKGKIASPAHRGKLTILEAISRGVLDSENVKSIVDTRTGEMITLADALTSGIIKIDGTYRDMLKAEEFPISQAVEKGLITSVTQKSIFDIDGFKDPVSGEYISLNAALLKGLISSKSGGTFTIDLKTGKTVSLSEAEEQGYIRSEVLEMLSRGIGVTENGREVSILEAVLLGLLDPKSGQLLDPRSKRIVPLEEAIKRGLITPDGAALLTSLLNIAVTTQTVTKTVSRYVTTLQTGETVTRDYKMSYDEALSSGLIDESRNEFRDPDSGATMSIEDAFRQSLLGDDGRQRVVHSRERTPDSLQTTFESTLTTSIGEAPRSRRSESPPRAIGTVTSIITKEIAPRASSTPTKESSSVTITIAPSTMTDSVSSVRDSTAKEISSATKVSESKWMSEMMSKTSSFEETHVVSHDLKSPLRDEKQDMETEVISPVTPTTSRTSEIMKFIDNERVSMDKRVFELPTDGWTLAEAIDRKLFDPATGLFIIPGTDRLVSFEECIKLQIINPNSGFVIDPNNGRKVSLVRSLEKNILDSTGHYCYPQKISMREAIANELIILEGSLSMDSDNTNQRLLQITRVSGKPDKVELTRVGDPSQQLEIKTSDEMSTPDPVQVTQGVIYDPATALVISTKTGKSASLLAAVSEGTIPSAAVIVKDPTTGKDISMADAVNRGILDINTREYKIDDGRKISLIDAAKFGVIAVLGAPLAATAAAIEAVQRTMVKDPVTGKKVPREVAIERGIIPMDENTTSPIIESASGTPDENEKVIVKHIVHEEPGNVRVSKEDAKSATLIDSKSVGDVTDGESLGTKTRARVTVEPRYQVTIGKARTLSQSPEREAKPIVLQKMRKRIVKVEEACKSGLIDVETADTFTRKMCNEKGEPITLSEAIRDGRIDANQGQIVDPQRGDVLSIKQAIDRGILDPESAHILVPLAKSLSVHSLYKQGLLEPSEGKIVHPETGAYLTLNEAIVCEIVDPLSNLMFTTDGRTETLLSAIANDIIDAERLLVKTKSGSVNLVKAIENEAIEKVFELKEPAESFNIPPAGMTFPVALKRGLIDISKKEIRHPITGEHLPLEDAIKDDFIMALPYPVAPDSIEITKALESGLIDRDNAVFFHPTTGTPIPIVEAVESGLLIIKPPARGENTAITETITSYHTITTKTVELLPGYALKSAMEVQDINTGNIITIEEARQRGIIKDESETKREFTTKDIKMSFDHAVEKGLVDMNTGIFTDPCTGTTMPIAKAVEKGILDTSSSKSESETPRESSNNSLTVLEAIERIYDEETGTFKDPETNESYNLTEAMKVGLIEPDSVLYNVKTKESITTREAVEKGLLDPVTGKMKITRDQKDRSISIAEATKMGLLAVIAAPVLAGKAVVDAISNRKSKETKPSASVTTKLSVSVKESSPPSKIISSQITQRSRVDSHESEEKKSSKMEMQKQVLSDARMTEEIQITETEDYEMEDDSQLKRITDEETPRHISIMITKELTPQILAEFGVFDPVREKFLDPETGTVTSFNDLVLNLKVFDPDRVLVKDLSSKTDLYVTLREAINRPLVDRNVANMVDPKTGKKIPFFEAVRLEWIKEEPEDEIEREQFAESQPLDLQEAIDIGVCNPITGTIRDPKTGQALSMNEAIDAGLIDADMLGVRNPITDEIVPFSEALETGVVDLRKDVVINTETRTEIDITTAFLRGLIVPVSRKPISLEAIIRQGRYDADTGRIEDPLTKQSIDVEEGVRRSVVDAFITEIEDTKAGSSVSLDDALTMNLVISSTGRLRDTKAGELLPLDVALDKGLIITTPFVPSLIDAIVQEYYSPKTGLVLNPMTGENLTLKEALAIGYVNGSTTVVKDDRKDSVIPLNEAEGSKLIDLVRGTLTYPHSMTLDVAFEKGYILSTVTPWTLQEALALQIYDPKSGTFNIDGNNCTLEEAIEKGFISKDSPSIKDPRNNDIISLGDAIKHGFINAKTSTAVDPCTSAALSLTDALDRGFIVPAKRKISLPDAVFKGLYDPKTGQFTVPDTQEKLPTDRAIKMGVIDATTAIVRDPNGDVMTFNKAIKTSIVDPKSGTVSHARGPPVDFQEALERGLLLETRRPMSFSEAISKGILDEKTNKFLDPQTGSYLTVLEAIRKNLIDADSVTVKDTRSSIWKTMTLMEAIQSDYIDGTTGYLKDPSKGNRNVSLRDAFESGLIVDNRAAVSLQRAIHQGLYDDNTGKITDPSTGRAVTLHEAMRKCIISPTLPCYWDKRGERLLSLAETCRAGVIDRRTGMFKEPGASGSVSLSVALQLGLIVDIESMGFGLYEAILMNMYDVSSGKFVHPTSNRKLTLAEACQVDLINPLTSIVKCTGSNRYVPLAEGISSGIVDDIRGMYVIRELDKAINLQEAAKKGFIVTSKMPLSIEETVKCRLYRGDSGKFTNPVVNEYHDLLQAINCGLVDPDTTALKDATTGQIKSLLTGIEDGTVDVSRGRILDPKTTRAFNIDVALERGLLVTIDKPLAQQIAHRSPLEASKAGLGDKNVKECTLEEAINYQLIDSNTSVVRDPRTGRFVTTARAIADGVVDPSVRGTIELNGGSKREPRFVRFGDVTVFVREPLTFEEAVEKEYLSLESGKFTDPISNEQLTLKEAVGLGIVDSDSALIKDSQKKKLVKLPEAFRKGMMDAEKGNVLDTATSKLYSLSKALEAGLLITPRNGVSFIEALQFGLYNPTTGGFHDPFVVTSVLDRRRLTLAGAIESGLIDPSTTVIKDPFTGNIASLLEAVSNGKVDSVGGRLVEDTDGKSIDFVRALERGYILAAEARQAVEEKYKLCDETLSKLLQWISEIEDKLANQDTVKEDVEQLRKQIIIMKEIKEDLESHSRSVSSCLDQIRQVVLTGSNVLSSDEVSTLEKNGRSLRTRFDKALDRTDKLVKRLIGARDELTKFKNELTTFSIWLDKARSVLEEKERSLSDLNKLSSSTDTTRDFISDVIAHQADLRFITMAAQKFVDESKEYLQVLNDFRTSLPQRLPHKEPTASQDSPVRAEVSSATTRYKDLLSRANLLSDRLSGVGGKQRDYHDSLDKARTWLREVEPKVHRVISEPVAAEPKQVEDQLSKAKALNNEFLANERLVDNAKHSVEALLRSLEGQLTINEANELEEPVKALEDKYKQLSNALADKCQELDTALVRSQGVQDALDSLVAWLNNVESQFKSLQRPASLQKERLEEQQREQRLLQADLDSHRLSVETITANAQDLLLNSSNVRIAKRIESKLKDVQSRFEKLMDKSLRRGEFLDEIAQALNEFLGDVAKFESWYAHMMEVLDSRDLNKLDMSECEAKMARLIDMREDQRGNFEDLIRNGKNLISKKDITEAGAIRDKIKALESQWKELNNLLDEKQRLCKSRAEQHTAYEKLRDQVLDWLTRTENKVQRLEPVAVDLDKLKIQQEDLKPIQKEYRDYGNTVDKINDLGIAYDSLMKERGESPTRRRGSASPTKRPVLRMSQDGRSPSPTKSYAVQSPVSPGGSSGFSSRRSSQDGFHLEELSPVQQQLSEINHRYGLLGVRLSDRQTELDNIREELKKHLDHLKVLSQFLDKIQRQLPKESMPATKDDADKTAKQVKVLVEEMYEKQSLLDSTRTQVRDLVRRKKEAYGVDRLNDEMEDVASRWRSISDRCKDRIKFLEDIKDFYDTYDGLNSWLGAKERMLGALGPISADPRMVASQVQQVQVLREEFRTQQPQLDHLIQVGESIVVTISIDSADGQKINAKLQSILQRWADQMGRLDERAQSLGDAVDTSREFDASLNRLRDALQGISDNLDELSLEKDPEEQLRKIENLERQLEGQRPLLADAEMAGAQLCEVLSDPASRSEIQGKLATVGKMYNNLQKKLDYRKAEIEGNLRDGRQFEASCSRTLGWLADELGNMSEKLLVSADREVLQQQLDHHEPVYRNVMSKEHEVIMLLNKGRDILARSQKVENRSLQRDLDKMQSQWDRLKKDTVERHTRLQTCAEHCKKYYKAQDVFLPWLRQAEDKLDSLIPTSFRRKDIEKQLKELSSFRNEVWKHSGEFENNKMLGETFVGACDIDKQNVKNELSAMKTR